VGAELFHADGWIDMKFIIKFRNNPKAPKNKFRIMKFVISVVFHEITNVECMYSSNTYLLVEYKVFPT